MLNAIQNVQNRVFVNRPTVALALLNFINPHCQPSQFGCVFVDFKTKNIVGTGFDSQLLAKTQRFRIQLGAVFQTFERVQG